MSKTVQMGGLLILLILIWGISWPIMSAGLAYCPPIWFAALRFLLAVVIVFVFFGVTKQLILPTKKDFPLIFSIGFFQMGFFVMFITLGLEYVSPGRSAIIAYLSPFFVAPIAVIFFGEELSRGKIAGLVLGAAGIALLFSPWEVNWHDKHVLEGNGLLVLSTMVWAGAMIHTRYATWHRSSHLLLPWQILAGTLPNLLLALVLVPHPVIHFYAPAFLISLFYNAILSSLVGYWLMIIITRNLPVITTSLALLAVPVVGLLASAVMVHEALTASILTSLGLIIAGLACVAAG